MSTVICLDIHNLTNNWIQAAKIKGGRDMKAKGWDTVMLSEPGYEHLVAELHFDGQFLLLQDREEGRDAICVAFPNKAGKLGARVPLEEFMTQLLATADDLRR